MSSSEHRIGDYQVRALVRKVELHNGGDPDVREFAEQRGCDALTLPQDGPVKSVTMHVGTRAFTYNVHHGPYKESDLHKRPFLLTCFADGELLTLVPSLPFPDARVVVEYDDAG